ncbi:BEN domain-containing protein 3-like [Mytilus edulis]|uniref:BEN domain-containing protein 3-like n=1 Tax=Mytilus edulis TaxID=6550 RepID=UPI0039EEB2B0
MNSKNDTVLRGLTDLEVMCTRLARQQVKILAGQHRPTIPAADKNQGFGKELQPGNFAAALTKRFYPELYGMDNLRYFYNWNSGGKHGKRQLHPSRREKIRQFTVRMYPEVRQEDIFRTNVINAVNEMLRRQPKNQRPALAAVQIENNPPEADPH